MKILILPGDGVGPEVTKQARKVINKVADIYNLNIEVSEALF